MFHAIDVQTGAVLSRHRDRESAGEMWAPEISAGEVEVIDLTERGEGRTRGSTSPGAQSVAR